MHRFALALMLACAPVVAFAEAADEPHQQCSALPTAAERIVCYDAQFPPVPGPDTPAAASAPLAQMPSNPAPSQSASEPSPSASVSSQSTSEPYRSLAAPSQSAAEQSQAPVASSKSDAREYWSHGMFEKAERVHEQSTIKAIRRRDRQNMVFVLANQQIWLQDSQRLLPFRVGDAVTITNGTVGGYFLTSDGGTKTRVRRIK